MAVMIPSSISSLHILGLRYEIDTDSCEHQVGFTLFQDQYGDRKPIGFKSRSLKRYEKKYHVTEKECLAIVYAVSTCLHYLMSKRFTVLTDHNALRWLMEVTDFSGRLMRWRLRLGEYDFDIKYKKGIDNRCADFASRMNTENSIPS